MTLTDIEQKELEELEANTIALGLLVKGGGSTNQLNRLLVLAQDQNRKLTERVEVLEGKIDTILTLVRKLQ